METIFSLSSFLVMPFWFLMILLPKWHWTQRIIQSPFIIAPAALLYMGLVLPQFTTILGEVANPTLQNVSLLLGSTEGATIGWIHFLAFDLFVARWAYLDNLDGNISPFLMAPILFFILMLGPIGFLLYLSAKTVASYFRPIPK